MSKKKTASTVNLSIGAQFASISLGYAEKPLTVLVNLNCSLQIILSFAKTQLVKILRNRIKDDSDLLNNSPEGDDFEELKAESNKLIELQGMLEGAPVNSLELFDQTGAACGAVQASTKLGLEVLTSRGSYGIGKVGEGVSSVNFLIVRSSGRTSSASKKK